MSQRSSPLLPSSAKLGKRRISLGATPGPRRASASGLAPGQVKAQRTSKTSQKLVVLPSAPQTKSLLEDIDELGYETDAGVTVRGHKSEAEKMSKDQRKKAGFKRITAYCVAESFKIKILASFLKREHNVSPRVFDEALYVMYHLPLLPGYGPGSNIRSSAPAQASDIKFIMTRLSEAEENGYQDSYFPAEASPSNHDGYMTSSPVARRRPYPSEPPSVASEATPLSDADEDAHIEASPSGQRLFSETEVAEAIFFEYGVVVFFGLEEGQEKGILEDIEKAEIMYRKIPEDDWEIEECHFTHDPDIAYPRIYNDFFTLKSRSHLLKLSISHALAQSTLLARYESNAQRVLSSPMALSIPQQLARAGALQLKRHEALKLTGSLFKLRRDVNLVSNVLDVPELFWSEASLKELYDAVREYMEIKGRVQVLNEKLLIASDFLDAIHDHLNNSAMERITWIVIWLIVVAILVELGEVLARLIFHAAVGNKAMAQALSRQEALRILDRMSGQ